MNVVVVRKNSPIKKTIKKHPGSFRAAVFLFVVAILFFVARGETPYSSELAYIEHSTLGRDAGSVVPASCDSNNPYASTYDFIGRDDALHTAHSGSHFNGDCTTPCPSGSGSYDPYYDPTASSCSTTTTTTTQVCPDGSIISATSTCPVIDSYPHVTLTVNGVNGVSPSGGAYASVTILCVFQC
jgi:hypothetical protein